MKKPTEFYRDYHNKPLILAAGGGGGLLFFFFFVSTNDVVVWDSSEVTWQEFELVV